MSKNVVGWALVALIAAPGLARAQCSNLTGNPAPQPEPYGANKVVLKYLVGGPGGNNDHPEIRKSAFTAASFTFDPATQHTVHITIKKNTISGPLMFTTALPPSSTLWTSTTLVNGNVRWKYNDPAATFGVKKAQLVAYVGGLFVWTYIKVGGIGPIQNVMNAPLTPNVDQLHLMIEIENGGTGVCYDGIAPQCTGNGNTQTCKVL